MRSSTCGRLLRPWRCRCEVLVRPSKHVALRVGSGLAPTAGRSLGNERGLALVITLFVVALVAVLVLEYHFDAAVELDLAANYANDVQAYHLALAGVRFAQALLQRDNTKADGPESEWYKLGLVPACFAPQQLLDLAAMVGRESLGARGLEAQGSVLTNSQREDTRGGDLGCVSLRITDEDSKLPINALMPPAGAENAPAPDVWVKIFQAFFESFKIDPEVVQALIDWIDPDDTPRNPGGAERSYYERLPMPYKPSNSRMSTPADLRLVKGLEKPEELAKLFPGVTPEAVADLDLGSNSYLTVFGAEQSQAAAQPLRGGASGNTPAKVNLNTAQPEVLTALIAGVQQDHSAAQAAAKEIVARRQEKQFRSVNEAVQGTNVGALSSVADIRSTYFRVESVGVVGSVRKRVVAVLKRPQQQTNQPNVTQLNRS